MKKRILILVALFVLFVAGSAVVSAAQPDGVGKDKEPVIHTVFCQKTGDTWKIDKGDDNSANKNRIKVGTWDEHLRGDWNDTKASDEFLSLCPKVETPPEVPKDPAGCKIGRVESYRDEAKQDPICVDDEVKSTTPTPVEDTLYPDFQGK